jgi:hypothetical protein
VPVGAAGVVSVGLSAAVSSLFFFLPRWKRPLRVAFSFDPVSGAVGRQHDCKADKTVFEKTHRFQA